MTFAPPCAVVPWVFTELLRKESSRRCARSCVVILISRFDVCSRLTRGSVKRDKLSYFHKPKQVVIGCLQRVWTGEAVVGTSVRQRR